MKLYNLTDTILTLASAVPNRGTQFCGDVYHISEIANASYPAFVLTNREVYQNRDEYYEDHHVIMFEFDRLTESQDNNLDVQSHSIQTLKAIVDKLEELGCIISVAQYTPFVQRFSDMCSGAMADIRLRIPIDDCYEYSFDLGDLIDLKDLYVTKNGNYIAAPNTAYKSIVVNVEGGSGTDLKYYTEDVDGSTNAQIKVNNNVVQVNRDGIELYDKDGNGRIIIDYDGVAVYSGGGGSFTWNDARVLTSNDLSDINTEISEIKSDVDKLNPQALDNYYTKTETNGQIQLALDSIKTHCPNPEWKANTLYSAPSDNNVLPNVPRYTQKIKVMGADAGEKEYPLVGLYYYKNETAEAKGVRVNIFETSWSWGVVYFNDVEWGTIEEDADGDNTHEASHIFPPYFEGWIKIYGDNFTTNNLTVEQYNVIK